MQNSGSLFRAGDLIWKRRKILSVGLCSLISEAGLITPQYLRMWLELFSEVRAVFGIKMSNGGEGHTCGTGKCAQLLHQSSQRTLWGTSCLGALCGRLLMGAGLQFWAWQAPLWVALQASDLENDLKSLGSALFFTPCPHLPLFLVELICLSG